MNEKANKLIIAFRKGVRYLFGRKYLAGTFWTVVGALVMFGLNVWYNAGKEPTKVFVTNQPNSRDTVVWQLSARDLRSLGKFLADRMQSTITNPAGPGSQLPLPPAPKLVYPPNGATNIGLAAIAQINVPWFRIPLAVKGYVEAPLGTLARSECPKTVYARNEIIEVKVEVLDSTALPKLTPFILTVLKRKSQDSIDLVLEQHYSLQRGKSLVRLAADFDPGEYQLVYGFYFLGDLNSEYPPFYRNACTIQVTDNTGK
ncbi:MAG: hypothetical protein WBW16_08680 [Bacteroidota bacterium]